MSLHDFATGAFAALALSASAAFAISTEPARPAAHTIAATQGSAVTTHYVTVKGIRLFYREAGNPDAPTILLLHGFPTSSHMYRDLIPLLSDRYHIVAPDLPGFGFSDAPGSQALPLHVRQPR
jgi:alpha-beta hydrolase superfamily lysophospholipase